MKKPLAFYADKFNIVFLINKHLKSILKNNLKSIKIHHFTQIRK